VDEQQALVMTSGGMDSTVLVYWAIARGYTVVPMFVNYGQHCADTELSTLQAVLPPAEKERLSVVNVADVFRLSPSRMIREADLWVDAISSADIMLPYRNLFLLATGAAFAASRGCSVLMTAFINSNHAQEIDATKAFLTGASALLHECGGVAIEMPFRDMPKAEVARLGIELNAPIAQTFSCQVNANEHCGSCPNCVERLAALAALREAR
jgi:7-cyano-7-deazaguanine synthase